MTARRIIAAFSVAPLVPSLVVACAGPFEGSPEEMLVGVFVRLIYSLFFGYLLMLVLGLPAFALLWGRVQPSALRCTLVGAAIAALPGLLLAAVMPVFPWGVIGRLAALGALGGVTFWAAAAALTPPARRVPEAAP